MTLLSLLAPLFERYITLERVHPTATYNYKARGFFGLPVLDVTMHKPKCTPCSWLYIATSVEANLVALNPWEKLYVGSQTSDRMFRGDGMAGRNFHHAQMRAGKHGDTPVNYLRSGRKVDIYRLSGPAMNEALTKSPGLRKLEAALSARSTKHIGYWIEQLILATDANQWRWNTAAADREAQRILDAL